MDPKEVLKEAKKAPSKNPIKPLKAAILALREKDYSWREIADFLNERGVKTDHTKIYRFIKNQNIDIRIPSSEQYQQALERIAPTDKQKLMLEAHFKAHNRTITFTELANAAGYDDYQVANRQYGQLGLDLGRELDFEFADSQSRPDEKFCSSSIGMPFAYAGEGKFQFVMHHELAKAIEELDWF